MGDYIYCSIGSFLSERMVGDLSRRTMVNELGRDLLWIMKGKDSL